MADLGATSPPTTYRDRQISATTTTSRPLSEISDNNTNGERRRSTTRESLKTRSRPSSEVKDFAPEREAKRASITMQHTITLNLNDYASSAAKRESPLPSPAPPSAFDALSLSPQKNASGFTFGPWAEPPAAEKAGNGIATSAKGKGKAQDGTQDSDADAIANPLQQQPSQLPNPTPSVHSNPSVPSLGPPISLVSSSSFEKPRSSIDNNTKFKPSIKPKPPQWLRKASGSGLAALRSKSRSPKFDDAPLPPVPSLPPALPPRKNQSASISERQSVLPPTPPPVPHKPSDLNETHVRPDRSSILGSTERPAPLTRKASRDNFGKRIAAWTANAHSAFPRSASSASLASQASAQSSFTASHQRSHSQAQKVIDGAGAAMQKGLAGLKARGMSGSISSLSSLGGTGRAQHTRQGSAGPSSSSWTSGFGTRSSKDHSRSTTALPTTSEGPEFEDAIVMRLPIPGCRPVFGHNLVTSGQATHVMDANAGDAMERQRRHCLPAVVVRCVEYLEIWGPKEEGIFRISGRSSHVARLKKEFDSGADIDMRQCHPGDLDPHAVAGLFKLYLRDLPTSVLTPQLLPLFDAYGKAKHGLTAPLLSVADLDREVEHIPDEVDYLLAQLPPAHWFLVADIVKLLDLIPRHEHINRMTPNALMISLGPSLNIPGGILTEFLTRRKSLFAKPPSTSIDKEHVADLIDFGSVDIAPPSIPQATMVPLKSESPLRSTTPPSHMSEDNPPAKIDRPHRISSKPSLTRLFTTSSKNLSQPNDQPSQPSSAVNPEPPRVDLTIMEMSPLPNFGKVPSPAQAPSNLPDTPADDHTPTQEAEEKRLEDVIQPTHGTVQERIKAYPSSSTPIADRFAKAEGLPPLRPDSFSSSVSTSSAGRASHENPATIIKRGQSPFFSGPGMMSPRSAHSRTQSGSILDKRSSTSSSVREMVRDMERRDGA